MLAGIILLSARMVDTGETMVVTGNLAAVTSILAVDIDTLVVTETISAGIREALAVADTLVAVGILVVVIEVLAVIVVLLEAQVDIAIPFDKTTTIILVIIVTRPNILLAPTRPTNPDIPGIIRPAPTLM